MKKTSGLLLITLIFVNLSCATLTRESDYYRILKEIRSTNIAFSFIKLKDYLREHPNSIYKAEIKFAMIEYYFQIKDYRDAVSELTEYIMDYSEGKNTIFAKAILYKILLEYKDEPLLLEKLKETFFSKSLFLIFSDVKAKCYRSILNNTYKVIDYVDKIEVFKNDEPFLKITP